MLIRVLICIPLLTLYIASITSGQQEQPVIIRPAPQENIVLVLPDIVSFPPTAESAKLADVLNQVLWDDLTFAGFFTVLSKSFYPPQRIGNWKDVDYAAWHDLNASFLSAGTLSYINKETVSVRFQLIDMKRRSLEFDLLISGDIRSAAHRWADEVVFNLTAGASRGIARTKIVYVSKNVRDKDIDKDIYVMDYDGHNSHSFIRNGSYNLFPAWAPDDSMIAFATDKSGKWELNIRSFIDGSQLSFPTFNGHISTPAFSPDGRHLAYALRSVRNDTDIYISQLNGSERMNLTNNPATDYSPTWSPSGSQLAFMSDRDGSPQIYICDDDGTNVRRFVKEGGEADSPSWSPDAQWIAFHWKPRRTGKFDIYIGEVSTGRILQLTSAAGNNVNPSWAPDSRHIVFESDRSGTSQIYLMRLNDPSSIRKITDQGDKSTPAWGGYSDN